jgi:hypothetical protein
MRFTVNNETWTAHFSHHNKSKKDRGSECFLHTGECEPKPHACVVGGLYGASRVHTKDQPNHKTGMIQSLTRAIEYLPRETRQQIWKEFFRLCPIRKHCRACGHLLKLPAPTVSV